MSYPQPPQPPQPPPYQQPSHQQHIQFQQPGTDRSKSFLNMSTGVLITVIALVILVCCIGPIVLCFLGGFLDALTPKPTVNITSCEMREGAFTGSAGSADIGFTIKNNSSTEESYSVEFEVRNDDGVRVGHGSDFVWDLAGGSTSTGSARIILSAEGGATCHLVGVD